MELLTADQALRGARSVAAALHQRRLQPGDRIAVVLPEGGVSRAVAARQQAQMIEIAMGALRLGVVPVLVNTALTASERQVVLADSQPELIIDSAHAAAELIEQGERSRKIDIADVPLARAMHYTSGTTGRPKGVWSGVFDELSATAFLNDEIEMWEFDKTDTFLVNSPLAHSAPLRLSIAVLQVGGSVLLPGVFDAAATAQSLVDDRPTTTFLVPSHLQRLQALPGGLPPSPFRLLTHAAAHCPPVIKLALHEWVGADRTWEFYGATEGQFSVCQGTKWEERPGTVGRARPGRKLTIDDGVIWAKCPHWARFEYWRDPEKTAQTWRGDSFSVGDLGYLDADGYLFLDGRREDLIVSGGVNVYPADVEGTLMACPGVDDVAVFGLDDERWGQRVCAAVVGAASDDEIHAWARERLAGFKRPKEIFRLDALPSTATDKVKRLDLPGALGLD